MNGPEPITVAITGGGGYLGSRLAGLLAEQPRVTVRALVRQPEPLPSAVSQMTADLLAPGATLDELCDGADTIVHLAGPNEVAAARDPEGTIIDVVRGTHHVATAANRLGVRRAVYVSTVHVYGARLRPGATVSEETPCEPRSPYAISRLVGEQLLASSGPPDLVILRLTNSVGAPASTAVERWSLVANDLCRQGAIEGVLRLRTSGTQWRDFVPLTDVVRVIGACAKPGTVACGTYNLGSGVPMTVRSLAGAIQQAFVAAGAPRPPLDAPDPEPDPPGPYRISVDRLLDAGLHVEGHVANALLETVKFCLEHRRELAARQPTMNEGSP